MALTKGPGVSRAAIKESLRSQPGTATEVAALVGLGLAQTHKHLQNMLQDGEVDKRWDNEWVWFLSDFTAPTTNEHDPESPEEPERIRLAVELLEIERMLIEANARRAEILRALA